MQSKHQKAWKDPTEGPKLKSIKKAIANSSELQKLDLDTEDFELESDKAFNWALSKEVRLALIEEERQKFEEEKRRRQITVSLERLSVDGQPIPLSELLDDEPKPKEQISASQLVEIYT